VAKYRQIHITFWQDPFIEELEPLEKYFYLYLMTNSKTTQCGCYEISMRLIKYETGLNQEQIIDSIAKLEQHNKIAYNADSREFLLLNWLKHNSYRSPKVKTCIMSEIENIKTEEFKEYVSSIFNEKTSIDSLSIVYTKSIDTGLQQKQQQQEEEKEQQQENKQLIKDVVSYLNDKTLKLYTCSNKKTIALINARVNEGFKELDQYKHVIDVKASQWIGTENEKYLRPETLFGTKFEGYLNEKLQIVQKPKHQNFAQSTISGMKEDEMKAILARKAQQRLEAKGGH